jgi:hypothetical protein
MASNPWRGWRAQTPSADFAADTVARILRDREGRSIRRRNPSEAAMRRWVTLVAAAAVFVGGAAWAWTVLPKNSKPTVAASERPALSVPAPPRMPAAVSVPPDSRAEPPPKPSSAPVLPSPRRKEAPPAASPPDGGRRVIVPMCNCQEAICDCLERH